MTVKSMTMLAKLGPAALMVSALLGSGCTQDTQSASKAATELTPLSLIATHAFDTPAPMTTVSFIPNDVASWLGSLVMLSDAGQIYVSDIEGISVKRIGNGTYTDIIGIKREKAAGIFLALTEQGALKAFIESSDSGDYSPLPLVAESKSYKGFCKAPSSYSDIVYLVGQDGYIDQMQASVENDSAISLTRTDRIADYKSQNILACAISRDDKVFSIVKAEKSGVNIFSNAPLYSGEPVKLSISLTQDTDDISLSTFKQGERDYIAIKDGGAQIGRVFALSEDIGPYLMSVTNGLSIQGADSARGVFATSDNFGGSAFEGGIVTLPDADANRIVILSRSYLLGELNTP